MTNKTKHTPIPIPQINGYGATPEGEIYSLASNWRGYGIRKLTKTLNGKGYLKVRVKLGKKRKNLPVHKLIAATFLPLKPAPHFEIRHLNGMPQDNRIKNLAWGTRQDNANDREIHGRTSRGLRHSEAIKNGLRAAKAEGGK